MIRVKLDGREGMIVSHSATYCTLYVKFPTDDGYMTLPFDQYEIEPIPSQ